MATADEAFSLPAFGPSYAAGSPGRAIPSTRWQTQQVALAKPFAASTSAQILTVELPRSKGIGAVFIKMRVSAALGAAGTITVNAVRVIADGGLVLWDSDGLQARAIAKHLMGSSPNGGAGASSTTPTYGMVLHFGRFARDPHVMIPPGFATLNLEIDVTTSQSSTNHVLDVAVEQYQGKPDIKAVLRRFRVGKEAISASEDYQPSLPRGGIITDVWVQADDEDNIAGAPVEIEVNDGEHVPFKMRHEQIEDANIARGRFDDATLPVVASGEKLYRIDLDPLDTLEGLDARGLEKVLLKLKAASSGTGNDVEVLITQAVPV